MRLCLPGLSDERYAECDAEIASYLREKAEQHRDAHPGDAGGPSDPSNPVHRSVTIQGLERGALVAATAAGLPSKPAASISSWLIM